jgi:signal transduction histidine kinase
MRYTAGLAAVAAPVRGVPAACRMKRLLSFEPVTVGAAAFSLGCHVLALAAGVPAVQRRLPFADEVILLVLLALALSAASAVVRRYGVFVSLHAVRATALWLISRMQVGAGYTLELAVMVSLLLDGALYGGVRFASWSGPILVTAVVAGQWASSAAGSDLLAGKALPLAFFAVAGCVAGPLLVLYRERLVDSNQRVADLENAVASLSTANRDYQAYSQGLESKTASAERNRITRDLHDTVGYALTNIIVMMDAAKVMAGSGAGGLPQMLEDARTHAEDALQETREILYRLRSLREIPAQGLRAVAQLVQAFGEATGVSVRLNYGNVPFSFGREIDATVFRFVQEGLTNAFRHGGAGEVTVHLWQRESEIALTVRDNGRGAMQVADGIGLAGMKERLAALGGALEAANVEGGFELRATIPFRRMGAA